MEIFNSIFFISIGMFINVQFLLNNFVEIILITLAIIVIKVIVIQLIFIFSKNPNSVGIMSAFGMAHIGELSFVVLTIAQENLFFAPDVYQKLLSASILSMFTIPLSMGLGKKISGYKKFKKEFEERQAGKKLSHHTIIAGFGINGQNIARILKLLGIPYIIAEMNPHTVKKFKDLKEPIMFGNIDRNENMKHIGINEASLLVVAISDTHAAARTVKMARGINPKIKIIVRVNYLSQVENLYKMGADLVLSQDMETSLIFIHHILKLYNIPDHVSRIQTNLLRKEHYKFFIKKEAAESWKVAMVEFIEQDNELFFIGPHSKHVNQKLADMDVYKIESVNILGIIRKNNILTEKIADIVIEKFDTIIFSGNHKKVTEALNWMEAQN